MSANLTTKNVLFAATTLLVSGSTLAGPAPYHNAEASEKAVQFAPGIISTAEHFEINTVFNEAGDHLLFARCKDDFSSCTMMESFYKQGQWQTPVALPFSGGYLEADPYFNEDYSQVYFVSKRPTVAGGEISGSVNLWRVALSADGEWQEPKYLASLSSDGDDLYPSITDNGDLYFPSFRNNGRQMYVAKRVPSGFEEPKPLPAHIYGEDAKIGDSVVLRDGNTIIFSISNRKDSLGRGDLYVSQKVDGKWTVAKSLGDKVNTPDHEFTPIVSPNGEYLFFTRIENGRGNLYQIKLSALGL
ncbi:TolB family protein [Corallincola platygyrae]|uniref:TolB family protein n=1 Tax=Corallincola platygyrae TaxID=1193278 RepID=A0ABW4XG27_9GAMM